jgi:hypothetical protein
MYFLPKTVSFGDMVNNSAMKPMQPNSDSHNAILGCSTVALTTMDGGNAIGLSGTILALRQTVLIWLHRFQVLTL